MRSLYFLLSLFTISSARDLHMLNENDIVMIKGVINKDSSNKFFSDLQDFNEDRLNIFISSPGGSVIEGMKIIDEIKTLQNSNVQVNCFGDFAASMAFVILQSCSNRYALESSILMQHQMSLGLEGPIENIKSYLKMIVDIENKLNRDQAIRIGLTEQQFDMKIFNDWWVSGVTAKEENVVDDLVDLKCSSNLHTKNTQIEVNNFFGKIKYTFSKCPLIRKPIKINVKEYNGDNINEMNLFFDTDNYIENKEKFIKFIL